MLADRYRLDALVGHGGTGEVWRAWDTRLTRPVAVKLLAPAAERDEALVERFHAEAHTAALLNHPGVVSVYDAGVVDDRHFLVMEYVPGCTLGDELGRDGPLALERAAEIAEQAAEGLAAAHRRGVVHRDIKPANLLSAEDGTVKIADFSIARRPGDPDEESAADAGIEGTSLYLAPEDALGNSIGTPGDVYSLGCTLYELLTGRPPFEGEHVLAVLCRHVEAVPVSPRSLRPDLPEAVAAHILRMLAKSPDERPTARETADFFAGRPWQEVDAADTCERTLSLPAPEPPPAPRPGEGEWRRRLVGGIAVVGAALTASALVLLSPQALGDEHPQSSVTVPGREHPAPPAVTGSAAAQARPLDPAPHGTVPRAMDERSRPAPPAPHHGGRHRRSDGPARPRARRGA